MKLGAALGTARRPPRTVTLRTADFADTYESKPKADVAIGLRALSERDLDTARAQAARLVSEKYADKGDGVTDREACDEAFNDALMRWAVAKATCNPNDATAPYFDMAEDVIAIALTPEAIRMLWDQLVILMKGIASAVPEATDEEIVELAGMLDRGLLTELVDVQQTELRKLLAHVHAALAALEQNDG
jgi:hypothetical protein